MEEKQNKQTRDGGRSFIVDITLESRLAEFLADHNVAEVGLQTTPSKYFKTRPHIRGIIKNLEVDGTFQVYFRSFQRPFTIRGYEDDYKLRFQKMKKRFWDYEKDERETEEDREVTNEAIPLDQRTLRLELKEKDRQLSVLYTLLKNHCPQYFGVPQKKFKTKSGENKIIPTSVASAMQTLGMSNYSTMQLRDVVIKKNKMMLNAHPDKHHGMHEVLINSEKVDFYKLATECQKILNNAYDEISAHFAKRTIIHID